MLITREVEFSFTTPEGNTPLVAAVKQRNLDIVKMIRVYGMQKKKANTDTEGIKQLENALGEEQVAWGNVNYLVRCGVQWQDLLHKDLIQMAINSKKWGIIRTILETGVDANTLFYDDQPVLVKAILEKKWGIVCDLIAAGADVRVPNEEGTSDGSRDSDEEDDDGGAWMVTAAIEAGKKDIACQMIKAGADTPDNCQGVWFLLIGKLQYLMGWFWCRDFMRSQVEGNLCTRNAE